MQFQFRIGGIMSLSLLMVGQLAMADIVVVVAAGSPIVSVAESDLEKLFLGRSNQVGSHSAIAADQKEGSVRNAFHAKVTKKAPDVLKRFWARKIFSGESMPPVELDNDAAVKSWLLINPNGIGYIDAKSVDQSVRVISTIASSSG